MSRRSEAEPVRPARSAARDERTLSAWRDQGSAVVDFVLIGALTTVLFAALVQLTLVLHVRSTLVDCAAEGARYGALADRTPGAGAQRARDLIAMSLHRSFADDVTASVVVQDGLELVEVQVTAQLPLLGLLGPGGALVVEGHALREVG